MSVSSRETLPVTHDKAADLLEGTEIDARTFCMFTWTSSQLVGGLTFIQWSNSSTESCKVVAGNILLLMPKRQMAVCYPEPV